MNIRNELANWISSMYSKSKETYSQRHKMLIHKIETSQCYNEIQSGVWYTQQLEIAFSDVERTYYVLKEQFSDLHFSLFLKRVDLLMEIINDDSLIG